jgi:3D (Asp-Asp-Asp) domain-containing protein
MKLQTLKKTLVGLALSMTIGGIAIPAHAAEANRTYVTKDNDTFWLVSQKLHVNLGELMALNPKIHYLNVYKGLTLKIPTKGKASATVKSKSVTAPVTLPKNSVQTVSGKSMAYSKVISGVASAYSEAPHENGGWGAFDYFGNPLKVGTIAVDPKVIPLGTKVYVTGYTFNGLPKGLLATATDIGGAIRGNRVDIFIPSSAGKAADFGMQNVKLHILK